MTRAAALASLHAAVLLFGLAALFGKWIALPATAIVLGRTLIAAATLCIVCVARREPIGRPQRAVAVNGGILALHWVAFFAAVQVASVAVALLGYASFPLFVLFLERRALTPRGRISAIAAAALAALGMAALVPASPAWGAMLHGVALGLLSGFTFAWLSVRNRRLVESMSATRIALWQNVFAALLLVPVIVTVDRPPAWPTPFDVVGLIVLGVLCTAAAHTLFIASLRRVSAHTASVVAALEPVYGIVLAAWLLREVPGLRTLLGGALIVAAALIASRRTEPERQAGRPGS